MSEHKKRLAVLDCCRHRFSKVVAQWPDDPTKIDREISLEIEPGMDRPVTVYTFISNYKPPTSNKKPADVVFTRSQDEELFEHLCACLDRPEDHLGRWHEDEDAIWYLPEED